MAAPLGCAAECNMWDAGSIAANGGHAIVNYRVTKGLLSFVCANAKFNREESHIGLKSDG